MKSLLEKTRSVNRILQKIGHEPVDYFEIAQIMSDNLDCDVFIVGRRGFLIGYVVNEPTGCNNIEILKSHTERFPESFNQEFNALFETRANIELEEKRRCIFHVDDDRCACAYRYWTIVPVMGGSQRIGTLILGRSNRLFSDEDIILAEYSAIVVANEIMRVRADRIEETSRNKAAVQMALSSLSYSEKEAIEHIIAELDGSEGLLVASRIADKVGITRSVIVSALRKLESAGVIESRSLGMKGTFIRVLNEYLFKELKK